MRRHPVTVVTQGRGGKAPERARRVGKAPTPVLSCKALPGVQPRRWIIKALKVAISPGWELREGPPFARLLEGSRGGSSGNAAWPRSPPREAAQSPLWVKPLGRSDPQNQQPKPSRITLVNGNRRLGIFPAPAMSPSNASLHALPRPHRSC